MSYFVGLDVSLRSVSVCIIDQEGLTVLEQSVNCEAETINICLHSFKDQITKVGFEAGVMSQTLFYGLQERTLISTFLKGPRSQSQNP